jgi:hypothetical protein
MRHRWIFATFCTLLIALVGCGEKISTKNVVIFPPADGDFVNNLDGRGTAQVWGMTFEVAEPIGGVSGSFFEGMLSHSEKTDARHTIKMGDDVNILLEKVPGSGITFQFNGENYGTLEVGDNVVIDKERNVTVNGTMHRPEDATN